MVSTSAGQDVAREWPVVACVKPCIGDGITSDRGRYEAQQLTDEQFSAEQVSDESLSGAKFRPGMHVIRDTRTGRLVKDDEGTLIQFTIRSSADGWILGQIYLSEVGSGRP
jgi:hypothetical protein